MGSRESSGDALNDVRCRVRVSFTTAVLLEAAAIVCYLLRFKIYVWTDCTIQVKDIERFALFVLPYWFSAVVALADLAHKFDTDETKSIAKARSGTDPNVTVTSVANNYKRLCLWALTNPPKYWLGKGGRLQ